MNLLAEDLAPAAVLSQCGLSVYVVPCGLLLKGETTEDKG